MTYAGIALALIAMATPALADRVEEPVAANVQEMAAVEAPAGVEGTIRRALDSLSRLRLHPGRDCEDPTNTALRHEPPKD
jgi:hypothetical protein